MRLSSVVEVTATAGPSHDGTTYSPQRVCFDAANTGHGTYGEPDKLDRYLDPDRELGLRALERANAAARERRRTDEARRRAVGCHNAYRLALERRDCACVYCDPEEHHTALRLARTSGANPFVVYRCLCGQPVPDPGQRCLLHRDAALVLLDGDGAALQRLAHDPDATPRR